MMFELGVLRGAVRGQLEHHPGVLDREDEVGGVAGGAARVRHRSLVHQDQVAPAEPRLVVHEAVADDAGADDDSAGPCRNISHGHPAISGLSIPVMVPPRPARRGPLPAGSPRSRSGSAAGRTSPPPGPPAPPAPGKAPEPARSAAGSARNSHPTAPGTGPGRARPAPITAGQWSGELRYHRAPAEVAWSGRLVLTDAAIAIPGLADPVQLNSAHAQIDGARVVLDRIDAQAGKLAFTGDYRYEPGVPRPHRLRLRAESWDAADLEAELMPTLRRSTNLFARALGRPW